MGIGREWVGVGDGTACLTGEALEGVHCGIWPGCGACGMVSFGVPSQYGDGTAPGCGGGGLSETLLVSGDWVAVAVGWNLWLKALDTALVGCGTAGAPGRAGGKETEDGVVVVVVGVVSESPGVYRAAAVLGEAPIG